MNDEWRHAAAVIIILAAIGVAVLIGVAFEATL